jgi:phosphoserine phosphatase
LITDRVLVTVTGPDRAGITATLTGILSQQGATLHDIEQVVVQGQLTLCLLIGVPETRDVLKELLFAAKELGMELDFKPVSPGEGGDADRPHGESRANEGRRYVITAIGPTLGAAHLHALASTLAAEGANIEKIGRLSEDTLASVEIHTLLPPGRDSESLRRTLWRWRPARDSTCRCSARASTGGRSASSCSTWTPRSFASR